MYSYDFRATGYPFRLYSGANALDRLPEEVARQKASRAFIVCGRTVSRKTPLIANVGKLLGERLAGVFDEIDKDTSHSSVKRATAAARAARADLVIGVGAGSVIQGARIVTILLAENRPAEELVTQYPEHGAGHQSQAARAQAADHQCPDRADHGAEPRGLADERR